MQIVAKADSDAGGIMEDSMVDCGQIVCLQ